MLTTQKAATTSTIGFSNSAPRPRVKKLRAGATCRCFSARLSSHRWSSPSASITAVERRISPSDRRWRLTAEGETCRRRASSLTPTPAVAIAWSNSPRARPTSTATARSRSSTLICPAAWPSISSSSSGVGLSVCDKLFDIGCAIHVAYVLAYILDLLSPHLVRVWRIARRRYLLQRFDLFQEQCSKRIRTCEEAE